MSRHRNRRPKPVLPVPERDTKHPPLTRWQARFALWYATQPRQPSVTEQVEAATRLAGTPVKYDQLKRVKLRKDWRELHDAMARGGIEAARAVLLNDLPTYMELHAWAAQRAKEKDDVRAMAALTTPAMDRVIPKRDEVLAQLNTQSITIVLTEKQLAHDRAPQPETFVERYDASTNSWVSDGKQSDPMPTEALPVEPLSAKQLPPGTMTLSELHQWRQQVEQPKPENDEPLRDS